MLLPDCVAPLCHAERGTAPSRKASTGDSELHRVLKRQDGLDFPGSPRRMPNWHESGASAAFRRRGVIWMTECPEFALNEVNDENWDVRCVEFVSLGSV